MARISNEQDIAAGALGVEQTHIYGPEVGLLGLVLNFLFAAALWFWISKEARRTTLQE